MNYLRRLLIITLTCSFSIIPVFAKNKPNLVSVDIPTGSGYFWCEVTPTENNPYQDPMSKFILKAMSVFVATHCVHLSGMRCGPFVSPTKGTLDTDLWNFTNHYFKYSKPLHDKTPYCQDVKKGNIQIRIDYDYELRCFTGKTPPKKLQLIDKKMC